MKVCLFLFWCQNGPHLFQMSKYLSGLSKDQSTSDANAIFEPKVNSRREMFGLPYRPPLIDIISTQNASLSRMKGLEATGPAELRVRPRNGKDSSVPEDEEGEGEEEEEFVTETVETFRFRVNRADLERAMAHKTSLGVSQSDEGEREGTVVNSKVDQYTMGDTLWDMDADMVSLLEGAEVRRNEDGKVVYRIEMDEEELVKMVDRRSDCHEKGEMEQHDKYRDYNKDVLAYNNELQSTAKTKGIRFSQFHEQKKKKKREIPSPTRDNLSLAGFGKRQTMDDLVGIFAIGSSLAFTMLLFDVLCHFVIHRLPNILKRVSLLIISI